MKTLEQGPSLIFPPDKSSFSNLHLPFSIWALSLSGFFLNFSSVVIFGCTPILMIQFFNMKDVDAGALEGTVEGFALVIRALSGMWSDFLSRRKPFIVWGFGICAFARFLLAPAVWIEMIIASRFIEKLGNGLQASPREAFISDVAPASMMGRAFGLNKALIMAGSFMGSLFMLLLFIYKKNFDIRLLLWIASAFSLLSFLLISYVKEPCVTKKSLTCVPLSQKLKGIIIDVTQFPSSYWKVLGIICIFKLGYFSGTFLMCKMRSSHISFFGIPLYGEQELANSVFLFIQCLACSLLAYPFGKISDKLSRRSSVIIGFLLMIFALLCFIMQDFSYMCYIGMTDLSYVVYGGIILYGLQMGTQGALMALLASTIPHRLHGTGFGLFFFTTGLSIIFTNQVIMNRLAGACGQSYALLFITGCIMIGLVLLLWITRSPGKLVPPAEKNSP